MKNMPIVGAMYDSSLSVITPIDSTKNAVMLSLSILSSRARCANKNAA